MDVIWLLTVLYAVLLLWCPALGPHDDYIILRTLQSGRWYPLWYGKWAPYPVTEAGRFSPLAGTEYNLPAALGFRTPRAYYVVNVIQLTVFVWILSQFS